MPSTMITQEFLRERFDYCPDTGALTVSTRTTDSSLRQQTRHPTIPNRSDLKIYVILTETETTEL